VGLVEQHVAQPIRDDPAVVSGSMREDVVPRQAVLDDERAGPQVPPDVLVEDGAEGEREEERESRRDREPSEEGVEAAHGAILAR